MESGFTGISVIIPTLNGAKRLPALLESLRSQNWDQQCVELIVVDDDSNDDTISVAKSYGAKILRNGTRNIERGKSIGMAAARYDMLLFIDDDNRLPNPQWLQIAVSALLDNQDIVGVQSARFAYRRNDPAINRYCSLFGINDPMMYYLKRRDRLRYDENEWSLPGRVVCETSDYWIIEFTPATLLTVGSQGFLTRRSLLQSTNWWPRLFHIDSNYELVQNGKTRYVMLKSEVIHEHCTSISQFVGKLKRNMKLFLEQGSERKFKYETSPLLLVVITLTMLSGIVPLFRSVKLYRATKDPAVWLHVLLCVRIPLMYIKDILAFRFARALSSKV